MNFVKRLDVTAPYFFAFIPFTALAVFFGSYTIACFQYLPRGVTCQFVQRGVILFGAASILAGALTLLVHFFKGEGIKGRYKLQKIEPADLLLVLLPLTPVIQYLFTNRTVISPLEFVYVILFFIAIACLFILLFPVLAGNLASTRIVKALGLAFATTITSMPLLSHRYFWYQKGSLKIQLLFMGIIFLAAWGFSLLKNKWVLPLMVVVFFLSNTGMQVFQEGGNQVPATESMEDNLLLKMASGKVPISTPNVYLLVYDSYVPAEVTAAYGIDNSAQEASLGSLGFTLYPNTYSVGSDTIGTMSRVLNVSTSYYGNSRRGVSGDGVVQRIFRSLGYKVYGIFPTDFMFRGIGSSYDYLVPQEITPTGIQLVRGILMGEFRFDLGFSDQPRQEYLAVKHSSLSGTLGSPIFVYSQSDLPGHSQNSGTCLPDETGLYQERLASANREMMEDVNTVLKSDPGAIIILAGDHGPYLTKNCARTSGFYGSADINRMDILDRFSTFLAIHWPDSETMQYDHIVILQDLFPAIFAVMYHDSGMLDARIESVIPPSSAISGVSVSNGVIHGGINDGELLYP
jgi:hypothetical protein